MAKWSRPANPPGPLFFNQKERDLVRQINNELVERVIAQTIAYYPISLQHTNYHPLYGEAMEKTFLPPVRVHALVDWEGKETTTDSFGIDSKTSITVHFHSRRLQEDQDLFVREGDFVLYGEFLYEIVQLDTPRALFGQIGYKVEISAKCIRARRGNFNAE